MRVCTDKSGKLIEMQSHATPGTLIQNAINSGYSEKDVVEREVSEKEWLVIASTLPVAVKPKSQVDILTEVLITKGTITKEDVESKAKKVNKLSRKSLASSKGAKN